MNRLAKIIIFFSLAIFLNVTFSHSANVDLDNNNKIDAQFLDVHATNHEVDATDAVFPADPDADAILKWNDTSGVLEWFTNFVSLDSPAFIGTPTAPTAVENTNTTQIATTAFVETATEPAQLLTDIKTVDGAGSGLDADTVDALDSTQFIRSDADDTTTGKLNVIGASTSQLAVQKSAVGNYIGYGINDEGGNERWLLFAENDSGIDLVLRARDSVPNNYDVFKVNNDDGVLNFLIAPTILGNTVWHAGNDGTGSTLDADLLDGLEASAFSLTGHTHDDRYYTESESDSFLALKLNIADIDDIPVNGETSAPISSNWAYDHANAADPHAGYMLESNIGTGANNYLQLNGSAQIPAVDGSLLTSVDADTIDTLESTQFLRSDAEDTLDAGNNASPLNIQRSSQTAEEISIAFITDGAWTRYLGMDSGVLKWATSDALSSTGIKVAMEYSRQGTPTSKTTSTTLTAAEIATLIITVNNGSATTTTLTLPTGSAMDTQFSLINQSQYSAIDFWVINTSTVAAEDANIATNTGWTLVGNMDIEADDNARARSSAHFRARKTGSGTWTLYRL